MLLFWASRLNIVDFVDELLELMGGNYYEDNVKYPVCAAFDVRESMVVSYPFCSSRVSK